MKLTTERLKRLIKEELTKILEGKEEDEMLKDMFLYGPGAGFGVNRLKKMQKNKEAADIKRTQRATEKRLQKLRDKRTSPSKPLPSPEELGDFQTGIEMTDDQVSAPFNPPDIPGQPLPSVPKSGKPMKLGKMAKDLRDLGFNATANNNAVSVSLGYDNNIDLKYGDFESPEEFLNYIAKHYPENLPQQFQTKKPSKNVGGTVDVKDPMMESIKRKWSKLV